jgi:hypothetical protein
VRVDDRVRGAKRTGESDGAVEFARRQTRRFSRHAVRALAELLGRNREDERGIHAAGKRDDDTRKRSEQLAQPCFFFDERVAQDDDHSGGKNS